MSETTQSETPKKSKYAELLKMGKDAIDAIKAPFKVANAKLDLQKVTIGLEQEIAELELKIQDAKGAYPINFENVLTAVNKKELKERELKIAKELAEELF